MEEGGVHDFQCTNGNECKYTQNIRIQINGILLLLNTTQRRNNTTKHGPSMSDEQVTIIKRINSENSSSTREGETPLRATVRWSSRKAVKKQ